MLGQVNNHSSQYNQDDLHKTLERRIGLTDKEIGGNYSTTEISNLVLVLGFMKGLDINEISVLKINLTDGLLLTGTQAF